MNYYKMRMMVASDVGEFLAKYPAETYPAFLKRMVIKYGVTEKMLLDILRTYGLLIEKNELVKIA